MTEPEAALPEPPDAASPAGAAGAPPQFTVGTLSYTKQGLWMLFFWLMWNDFTVMMMEQVASVNGLTLVNKLGASYTFAGVIASIGGLLGMWINPFFSTWSDRTRTRMGRRRPFLLLAAPMFAITLIAIPYAPDFYHWLMQIPFAAAVLNRIPALKGAGQGEIHFYGAACILNQLFNAVLLALFSYYYWDVVPGAVLGRFQAMGRVITSIALMVWNFYIFGHAEDHLKAVYLGVSLFCLTIYMMSVWRVKEGEYPPPEPRSTRSPFEPIMAYFRDCFSKPYFLWIFIGSFVSQTGNMGNNYITFYLIRDLKLSYAAVGEIQGVGQAFSMGFGLLFGFWVGSMTDRLKPLRIYPFLLFIRALIMGTGFFLVHDKYSAMVVYVLNEGLIVFLLSVAMGAATVVMFPWEKLGQFCSAQAFFYQTIFLVLGPIVGHFYDVIHFNRLGYMWGAVFQLLAGFIYLKVYYNWKRLHAPRPVEQVAA